MKEAMMLEMQQNASLWVFAYGSLLWKPGFHHERKVVGYIKGFKRRFFQGNTNLRGSVSQPGRVAILVPDDQEVTWGVAYEIRGQQHVKHAIEHLYMRENTNGGYHTMLNTFHPRPTPPSCHVSDDSDDDVTDNDVTDTTASEPFSVISFTATPASDLYLGSADIHTMAKQVVAARGEAGSNAEYVLRTAEFVRDHIPEDEDQHLFSLERSIRDLLAVSVQQQQQRRSSSHCEVVSPPTLHSVTVPV